MLRSVFPWSLLFVLATLVLAAVLACFLVVFAGIQPPWHAPVAHTDAHATAAQKVAALRETLELPVTVEQGFGPSMSLWDALDFLSDRHGFAFVIDREAFQASGIQQAHEQPVSTQKLVNVKLGTILKMLLAQVKGDEDVGTFIVLPDHLLITTTAAERFRDNLAPVRRGRVPTATVQFDRRPVGAALRELALTQGLNIVLDHRQEKLLQTPVTADFQQVPIDTIVRLLTDMANLRSVPLDNTLYVTAPENARALEAEQEQAKNRQAELLRDGIMPAKN